MTSAPIIKALKISALNALMLMSILVMSGCSKAEDPEIPSSALKDCAIIIGLKPSELKPEQDILTRSKNQALDEERVRCVHLFLVTENNTVYPLESRYIWQNNGIYEYRAHLNLNQEYVTYDPSSANYYLTGRIVAVTNIPDTPLPHPFDQAPYPMSLLKNMESIPMWGVGYVENLHLEEGSIVDSGIEITLLRSVSKISFELDDDLRQLYRIESITASEASFEQSAYCQPGRAGSLTGIIPSGAADYFNPVGADSEKGSIDSVYGVGTDKAILYVPERLMPNTPGREPIYFEVTLTRKDGTGKPITGRAYLCDYKNGTPDYSTAFDRLLRNHHYQYIISLAELEFIISFQEWTLGGKVHIELE